MTKTDPLATVSKATAAISEAQNAQREAIVAAHSAGFPVSKIAEAAGLTRQRVYQLVQEAGAPSLRERQWATRLAELDHWYAEKIETMSSAFMPDAKTARRDQAYRNKINGRSAKKNARTRRTLPTVRAEARGIAEAKLLAFLEGFPNDSLAVRIEARLDERAMLRDRLTQRAETRLGL